MPKAFLMLTAACLLAGQYAHAQSDAFREYDDRITSFQRNFAIAYVASICQIRSKDYASVFNEARYKVMEGETVKHRLSKEEWKAVSDDLDAVSKKTFAQIRFETNGKSTPLSACSYLPDSPELSQTDATYQLLLNNLSRIR